MKRLTAPLLSLFLSLGAAWAAEPPGRAFAPVQYGYQANAAVVPAYIPGRALVKLTEGARQVSKLPAGIRYGQTAPTPATGLDAIDRVLADAGAKSLMPAYIEPKDVGEARRLGVGRWLRVDFAGPFSASEVVDRLSRLSEVEVVTLDYVAFPAVVPPDPMHSGHWGHNNTGQLLSYDWTSRSHQTGSPVGTPGFDANAQFAWDGAQGYGSSSVIIAIIDSGVQAAHPDLLQVTGYDFGDDDTSPDDDSAEPGHGTACAGVAAARTNSLGTAGIAAGCRILPLKVADNAGTIALSAVANALYYAADNGADIISMSLVAAVSSDPATDAAIEYAYNSGCTIVAATGNENASSISYPANHSLVIGVGAASPCGDRKRSSSNAGEVNPGYNTDPNGFTCDGERWWGSNYGVNVQDAADAVDVIAPTILATTDLLGAAGYDPGDYSNWFNGTSCATPYVAGVCALIESANPNWTPAQIRARLLTMAQDIRNTESGAGWDRYAGYGMVDAVAALEAPLPAATAFKQFLFNQDGVLPSSESGIAFFNSTSSPETDLYAVTNGLLRQRTLSVEGNASYLFPNVNLSGGGLDANQAVSMEARVRILRISSGTSGGGFFQFFDGANRRSVFFRSDGLEVMQASGSLAFIPFDVSSFHDYLLMSPGRSPEVKLFIDGNLAFVGTAPSTTLNGFDFGDGITAGAGADADWDFVHVSQTPRTPIRSIPGLQSITFFESTSSTDLHSFVVNDARLQTRVPDPLNASNADFIGVPGEEFYDVYYSDADGIFNVDGPYVSIEAVFNHALPWGGGLNIAEVQLDKLQPEFGNVVSSFVALGDNADPSAVNRAVDGNLSTFTTMGNTIGQGRRLRITVGFASSLEGPAIRVLSLGATRAGQCPGGTDWTFLTGNAFASVRTALQNPGNFGPSGIVRRSIEFLAPVEAITPEALQSADVVLISELRNWSLTPCESSLLTEFVRQGGGLFVFHNHAAEDFAAGLGATADGAGSGCAVVSDVASPITAGPFGAVTGCIAPNYHNRFQAAGPNGAAFLSDGTPVGASFSFGAGHAVLICDEEWCMSTSESGCAIGTGSAMTNAMFMNAVAYVAPSVPIQFVPPSAPPQTPPPFGLTWGGAGSGDGQFNQPRAVAFSPTGDVYVADTFNSRIQKFTPEGAFLTGWGSQGSGPGQFQYASSIATDAAGNVYVVDNGNCRIEKFTSDGTFLTSWGSLGSGDGQFNLPTGIAVSSANEVYVADQFNQRIQVFSADGAFRRKWGSPGSEPGQFAVAAAVAVDATGGVFVVDGDNHRIEKFTSDGQFLLSWGSFGTEPGQFDKPAGIAVGPAGRVYVADQLNHRIQEFTSCGEFLASWGNQGTGLGLFDRPTGIEVHPLGAIYVADYGNNRIQKFGTTTPQVVPPPFVLRWGGDGQGNGLFGWPNGVAWSPDGSVYVTDSGPSRLQKFTLTGGLLATWEFGGSAVSDVAVDDSGCVYVGVYSGIDARIDKYDPSGHWLMRIGSKGEGVGQFGRPYGLTCDNHGYLYVADVDLWRVQKFQTSNGDCVLAWGSRGGGSGEFSTAMDVAADGSGRIFVVDGGTNQRVQVFSESGEYITEWGQPGSLPGQFNDAYGIACGPNGSVFVTEVTARVQEFSNGGVFLTSWGSQGSDPGEFSLNVCGIACDGNGNVYVADGRLGVVDKFGAGAKLPPVVLVNGYCGQSGGWSDLVSYLNANGFETKTFDFSPNNDRPTTLAAQLANQLDVWYPNQNVNVIAHSMGGLVTRQYIRQRTNQSRIDNLITLDTPHHGVDLMLFAFRHKTIARWIKKLPGRPGDALRCLLDGNGAVDLLPGSQFLNNLNYDNPDLGDKPMTSSRGAHPQEISYDPNLPIWSFAGTQNFDGPAYAATVTAWASAKRWYTFGVDYLNDGVVGVDAAVMWNDLGRAIIDTNLGLVPWQHFSMFALYLQERPVTGAQELFPKLENILRGAGPSNAILPPENLLAGQTEAPTDSVVDLLVSEEGTLTPGQVLERPAIIPSTPMLRVSFVADNAVFHLRKPDGTVLTPGDTVTTSGLHYIEDPTIKLGIYSVENPTPGSWRAVIDASSHGASQEYAVAVEVVSTTQVVVEPSANVSYTSAPVRLRASLQDAGVLEPSASWQVTTLRPDSTTFTTTLYDDGAHGDSLAGDGVFANNIPVGPQPGRYLMTAQATSLADSATYIGVTMTELLVFHDLVVQGGFQVTENPVHAGDNVTVGATIRNNGTDPISSVSVEFWDNQTKFGTAVVSLPENGSAIAQVPWAVALPDTHNLRVTVDPFAQPDEVDYTNNTLTKQVILGQGIVGIDPGQTNPPRLSLAPPRPNPSAGHVSFAFRIPGNGRVNLDIYSVGGRRIKHWDWPVLPAGPHAVDWNGRADNGQEIAPGVLFYELRFNGQCLRGKLIHLQ